MGTPQPQMMQRRQTHDDQETGTQTDRELNDLHTFTHSTECVLHCPCCPAPYSFTSVHSAAAFTARTCQHQGHQKTNKQKQQTPNIKELRHKTPPPITDTQPAATLDSSL